MIDMAAKDTVAIVSNMKAEILMRERLILSRRAFVEIVIWKVPQPLRARFLGGSEEA
jgi:hypothetical protein